MADTTSAVIHATDTSCVQKCASCGKHAKLLCTACNHCPVQSENDVSTIYYCNKDCQASHWTKHKSECKARIARRSLYRAADLAQKIYLELCFQTWGERVTSVEDDGQALHIHNVVMGGHVLYHPFPAMRDFGDDDRAAVAVHANCDVGMMTMWEVIKVIFEGQNVQISEVKGKVLSCPRQTIFHHGAGSMTYKHVFWRMKLNTNAAYALDLSSAQFGHYDPLTLEKEYKDKLKFDIEHERPGGYERYDQRNLMNHPNDNTRVYYRKLGIAHGDAIVAQLRAWEKDNYIMARLFRLPSAEYESKASGLVQICKTTISKSIQSFHDNGTLIQQYGMTLLKNDPMTRDGYHPFEGDLYKAKSPKPVSNRSASGIYNHRNNEDEAAATDLFQALKEEAKASGMSFKDALNDKLRKEGWFDDPEATRTEADWRDKRYAELTIGQKEVVKKAVKTQAVHADDLTSYRGGCLVVVKPVEGPSMLFMT